MTGRRLPLLLTLTLTAGALCPPPAAGAARPAPAEEVRQRAERVLATPGYQTAMPDAGKPEPPAERSIGPWAALLLRAMYWLVIAGAALLVVYLLWDLVARRGRRRPPAADPDRPAPTAPPDEPASRPLPDPEELARQGRFGEAVHALLLTALARLARRRGTPLPPSLTSREVLALGDLSGEPRTALAELVTAVERFLFAGRPLGEADWRRCRQAFRRLHPDAGGAA